MGDISLPPIKNERKNLIESKANDTTEKLQVVLAGDEKNRETKTHHPSQVSTARRRFARATLSVLNQVIHKKTAGDSDEDETGNAEATEELEAEVDALNTEANCTEEMETRTRRQSHIKLPQLRQKIEESQDVKKKRKHKLSLASVVNMAQFRKIYMSKLMDQATEKQSPVPESPEPQIPEALPDRPRFIATLSPEAQFAALKAYEDVLLDKLQRNYPEQRNNLFRVRTPTLKRVSFPLESKTQYPRFNGPEEIQFTTSQTTFSNTSISSKNQHREENSRVKRRLTVRFQAGMDILDRLKSSQGMMITSPRMVREESLEPVLSYNNWTQNWADEFLLNDK